jgi:hypothetical protein
MFPDVGDKEPHGRTGIILFGGGGGSISLPDRFAYTVHIYNLFEILSGPFLRIFRGGGEHFCNRDLSVR